MTQYLNASGSSSRSYVLIIFNLFAFCRYPSSTKRTATMSGRSNGITSVADSRATGFFSSTWRGRTRLQQKSGQTSQELAAQTQGTKAQVRFFFLSDWSEV